MLTLNKSMKLHDYVLSAHAPMEEFVEYMRELAIFAGASPRFIAKIDEWRDWYVDLVVWESELRREEMELIDWRGQLERHQALVDRSDLRTNATRDTAPHGPPADRRTGDDGTGTQAQGPQA